jgi:PAS domain S-box-containing protein
MADDEGAVTAGSGSHHRLLESLTEHAVILLSPDGEIVLWNAGAERLTGRRRADVVGEPLALLFASLARAEGHPADLYRRAIDDGKCEHEGPLLRADGGVFAAHIVITPAVEDGRVVGLACVIDAARDVSAMKQAEEEMRRQRALLQSVLDCVVESVAVFDGEGRLLFSNPAYQALVGVRFRSNTAADERFKHYGIFDATGTQRIRVEDVPANRAMRGEVIEELELVLRSASHPEGILVSTNARQLFDAEGAVIGAVVTGRDVTARRAAEQRLIEQKHLLEAILDCLGEAVAVYDSVGRILLANPAAERLLTRDMERSAPFAERARVVEFYDVAGERRLDAAETAAGRALRGLAVDDLEVLLRLPGRPDMAISSSVRPLRGPGGAFIGAVITTRDITARKKVEKEKEALLTELRRSNDELAQFAYAASHDLRSPLRAIKNLASWLEKEVSAHFTADAAEYMSLLRGRVDRMDRLLKDLLEYAQVDRAEATLVQVVPRALVDEVIALVDLPSGFAVTIDIEAEPFETAALPLKRALLNLVANAITHHDRPSGELRIKVRDLGPRLEFSVSDDGPGIPEKFHRRIFEMFQTLRARDDFDTSGMGLALVKKIVERAGGVISVHSSGRGCTFTFDWPKRWRVRPS